MSTQARTEIARNDAAASNDVIHGLWRAVNHGEQHGACGCGSGSWPAPAAL